MWDRLTQANDETIRRVVITDDSRISRNHCRIQIRGESSVFREEREQKVGAIAGHGEAPRWRPEHVPGKLRHPTTRVLYLGQLS